MIKRLFRFVLLLSITALFSSCIFLIPFTYKVNLDKQNPADQNATVTFKNNTEKGYFQFKEWNEKDIKDDVYKKRMIKSNDIIKFTVPAGSNSFTFDITYEIGNSQQTTVYPFKNIELRYDFEPGKKYTVKGRVKFLALGFKGVEFYVSLYENSKKAALKEWMIGKR
jgi:hypothetical protein